MTAPLIQPGKKSGMLPSRFARTALRATDAISTRLPIALARVHRVYSRVANPDHHSDDQYLLDAAALIACVARPTDENVGQTGSGVSWIGTSMGAMVGMMLPSGEHADPPSRNQWPPVDAGGLNRIGEYVRESLLFPALDKLQTYLERIHASVGPLTDSQWGHSDIPQRGPTTNGDKLITRRT